MRQKYVCVSTLRLKRTLYDERVVLSIMVNLIIEEESRKLRNICIHREVVERGGDEEDVNLRGRGDESSYNVLCSCHELGRWWVQDSRCWYVECIKEKIALMDRISTMLACGLQVDHGIYFGRTISFREI